MGETIRCLMVAAIAMAMLVVGSRPTVGQGLQIPQSLADAVGNAADAMSQQSRDRSGATPPSMSLPDFTADDGSGMVRPRAGGPTTDPVSDRDRNWMNGSGSSGRPSTDPLPGRNGQAGSSAFMSNQLRRGEGGQAASATATDRRPEASPRLPPDRSGSGDSRSTSSGTNFAGLPDGVRLPPRNPTAAASNTRTFGSEFARDSASAGNPSRPVYGPPTAEQANFDWSAYNAQSGFGGSPASAGASGSDFAGPPQMSGAASRSNSGGLAGYGQSGYGQDRYGQSASGDRSDAGTAQQQLAWPSSGLGYPGGTSETQPNRGASPTTNWTREQIAALGAQFNLSSNDPRLQDQRFVNDLYVRYHQWQDRQASVGQSNTPSADNRSADGIGNNGGLASSGSGYPTGVGATASWPTAPRGGIDDPRLATTDPLNQPLSPSDVKAPSPPSRSSGRAPRKKQLYDAFGNPVDEDGNVLDQFGNPVDEATAYEMTIGKKLREDMARLAKQQADMMRQPNQASGGGPADHVASADGQAGRGADPSGTAAPDQRSRTTPRPGGPTASTTPPEGFGDEVRRPQVDQAGVGSGAMGRSNPYVNVFLLCSLVSNCFLFVWLHRLWHHHRDLIASTRMASSGISSND